MIGGILLSFVLLSVGSATRESLTYDEIVHSQEGLNHLQKQTFAIDTYNPPLIRELQMLAVALGSKTEKLFVSRLVTVALGLVLLISVYLTTRKHFGAGIGLFALFFLAFEPNFLGHSHYVTLDIGTALFFFLAYISLLRFWEHPNLSRTVLFGVAFGLALASRVIVIPYLAVSAALLLFHSPFKNALNSTGDKLRLPGRMPKFLIAVGIAFFVVWATYFFRWDVVIAQGGGPGRVSRQLKNSAIARQFAALELSITFLENRPLPLGNYLATVKNLYLRGTQNSQRPAWYELLINILLKTPIPLLLLVLFALLKAKKGKMLFAAPIIGVLGVSVVTGMDPRIRYILPVYPFLAVVAAVGVKEFRASLSARRGVYGSLVLGVLFVWYAGGALLQYPHFISYANEFVPHAQRYMYFTDSNIDWGQALPDIKLYINEHKSSHVSFSYFGRDNGNDYGLVSNREWGSYKFEEICAFHEIALPNEGKRLVAISVSNWYGCGYNTQTQYAQKNIQEVIADSVLIFTN